MAERHGAEAPTMTWLPAMSPCRVRFPASQGTSSLAASLSLFLSFPFACRRVLSSFQALCRSVVGLLLCSCSVMMTSVIVINSISTFHHSRLEEVSAPPRPPVGRLSVPHGSPTPHESDLECEQVLALFTVCLVATDGLLPLQHTRAILRLSSPSPTTGQSSPLSPPLLQHTHRPACIEPTWHRFNDSTTSCSASSSSPLPRSAQDCRRAAGCAAMGRREARSQSRKPMRRRLWPGSWSVCRSDQCFHGPGADFCSLCLSTAFLRAPQSHSTRQGGGARRGVVYCLLWPHRLLSLDRCRSRAREPR